VFMTEVFRSKVFRTKVFSAEVFRSGLSSILPVCCLSIVTVDR